MKKVVTGTLIDRMVQLDGDVDLPNHSRVSVSLEALGGDLHEAEAALERFLHRAEQRAFDSGGKRFTRDELHERH